MKILLVEDDTDMLDVTAYALRREGLNVIVATDGAQALRRWELERPHLVVLDVGLPRMDGFEVCRRIRQSSSTPVILLTGLNSDEHVVRGFRAGADDYVTKPFSPRQLAARIRAIAARSASSAAGGYLTGPEPARELRIGSLVIDSDSHEVRLHDKIVRLTRTEFRLLHLLGMNVGRVVSSTRLVEYGWGYDEEDVSLLKTHISHIRTKLGLSRGGEAHIASVARVGYKLVLTAPDRLDSGTEPDEEDASEDVLMTFADGDAASEDAHPGSGGSRTSSSAA
jgi:DNA-binding response OmpR family regulator